MAKSTNTINGLMSGWESGTDGWGADMNTNLDTIMALMQAGAVRRELDEDTISSPALGETYLVHGGAPAVGDEFETHEDDIAIWWKDYDDSVATWKFYTPWEGLTIWVNGESRAYTFDGTNWIARAGFTLQLSSASNTGLGASHAYTTILGYANVPCNATLVHVSASCSTVTGVATAEVYQEDIGTPATVLTGPITLTAKTATAGTISESAYDLGDILGLRVETAGGGDVKNVSVTLHFVDADA
jgi:hypothetical protein